MTPEPTVRVLSRDPAGPALLLRAALPAVPGLRSLPGVRRSARELPDLVLERHDVAVEVERLREYAAICGFGAGVPTTYPHVMGFGLQLALMADPAFPIPAVGAVHVANVITARRVLAVGERVSVSVRAARLRAHPKGRAFDLDTVVSAGGEPVWSETSTYLLRGAGDPAADRGPRLDDVPVGGTSWRLPRDLGRRYAAVSGDYNPIHLSSLGARAFGYPRPLAHGMWTLARCVAALGDRLPAGACIETAFRRPVLLPATVGFGMTPAEDGWAFSLRDPRTGAPHLAGRVTPLPA